MIRISLFLLILFSILASGCGFDLDSNAVESNVQSMPNDFNFSVQFGVNRRNEINTFEDKVTKDLIENGTATTKIALTDEEMAMVYQKMKDIIIIERKELIPKTNCMKEPHEEDEWNIRINGKTITLSISGAYCEPTTDATQLIELRNYVFNIVKNKVEYKELPASKGGYE
ncbi:hypothetical protein AWH56_011270 [Anaerobacillus isosaccharinicus]|uniref:Uncharacterized protein n=1 Tax=Anaerobacillus isosaccharinicus TaxID=1532552 RepID=A0A7S7RDI4_9BACI|nr:hypothetical protein [Anaerobacillus isosaccharinicus]MBA5588515.1 hypothetical protein [Anaerobacillus isosaccharinicus]QOY38062.1 hypothetical protein AWH56_011270 [Anaerobacillus isosaccharinicus]